MSDLDAKGRCCGRKPLVYKRTQQLFCCRCDRAFDLTTKKQVANWAWETGSYGGFRAKSSAAKVAVERENLAAYHGDIDGDFNY